MSKNLGSWIEEKLEEFGVNLEEWSREIGGKGFRVVCVTPDLKSSVEEMSKVSRDQVVMVRVDEETCRQLDVWVETGAVKSRSEAAALFIREGLKVRSEEMQELENAVRNVQDAREKLKEQAKRVFGNRPDRDESAE